MSKAPGLALTGCAELGTEALPAGSADVLYVLKVTKAANGDARIRSPRRVRVPRYSFPPPAPQKGAPFTLDTLDARPTQAVAAKDPSKSGRTAVWIQHTVAGGAGTEVGGMSSTRQRGRCCGGVR